MNEDQLNALMSWIDAKINEDARHRRWGMNEDQLNALMSWVDAKINRVMDRDCIGASLSERELREELKNIMLGDNDE